MTKSLPQLSGSLRTVLGRQVNALRRQGITPATIYGHQFTPISVQFDSLKLRQLFSHAGESTLVEVTIGDQKYPVLFKNPQYHPLTGDLLHLDCHKVNLKEKIVATVPVELVGESPAVKNGNVLVPVLSEIEVEALPTDLPEKIIVDISTLVEVNQMVTVENLPVDRSKVEVKTDASQVIVKVEEPKVEEEPVAAEAEVAPGDVPATEQKSPEEKAAADAEKKDDHKDEK